MRDIVITCLLTAQPDPQRGKYLASSVDVIAGLRRSVHTHGHHLVVITDCLVDLDDDVTTFVRVPPGGNPYFERWGHIARWLGSSDAGRVWCVDGTDVVMLHDPFPHMLSGTVYCGSEPYELGGDTDYHRWLWFTCPSQRAFYEQNPDRPFLNMGLLGGDTADIVIAAGLLAEAETYGDKWEMGVWQKIAYDLFCDRLVTGHPVHTEYRTRNHSDPVAWWAHQ